MRKLMRMHDARAFLIGQTFSILGDSALWLAMGIWVKVLSGSTSLAGLTFFFFALPTLASPLAGLLVDRVKRKPLLIITDAAVGVAVLTLLFVHDGHQIWLIWSVMALYGFASTITGSAQSALMTVMLPESLLGDANGALRTIREGLRLFAPLVGAGLFALLGGGAVAVVDSATFVISIVTLLMIRVKEPDPIVGERAHWTREIQEGFRHIGRTVELRQLTIATAAILLVIGFLETVGFAIVSQGLHQKPAFLGVIVTIQGVGALIGGPTAAPIMRRVGEGIMAGLGIMLVTAAAILWTFASLPFVVAGAILFGISLPWIIVGAYTMVQKRTPAHLQGRTFSAFDFIASTPQTISIALGAIVISFVPYQILLVIIAIMTAASGIYLLSRKEQRIRYESVDATVESSSDAGPATEAAA
jgi:MFS family permease